MDIRMLLDMDNLDGTIAPPLYSNRDPAATPSNTHITTSGPDMANPPIHPKTIYTDEPHDPVLWDRHAEQYTAKPWPPVEPYQYSSLQGGIITNSGQASDTLTASFQNDFRGYHFPGDPRAQSENPSPDRPHEDIQWQMYLTESRSNLSGSLDFNETLSYPALVTDNHLSVPSEGLSSSSSSPFPLNSPDIFDPLSFIDLDPPLSAGFPSLHTIASSHSHGNLADVTVTNLQEGMSRYNQTLEVPTGTPFMGLTPPVFDFGSARLPSLETPAIPTATGTVSPPIDSSPARGRSATRAIPSPALNGCGLSGWDDCSLQLPPMNSFITRTKRRRSPSASPDPALRRPYRLSPLSSCAHSEETNSTRGSKRSRISTASRSNSGIALDLDTEEDGDSDDYRPSRSSSPERPLSSLQSAKSHRTTSVSSARKKFKRGKGKAKGSAALALAVVTQLGTISRSISEQCDSEVDALTLYQEGRTGIRKRKNHPIPLPVPIPNLNKKSRGRKVPYVADLDDGNRSGNMPSESVKKEEPGGGDEGGPDNLLHTSGRPRRRTSMPEPAVDELAGSRTYVCVVSGCGKCFVRGEHLKRHVRSIHTHDKPHPCPYEGCNKSFSRRDNLGQHVRIHLES